MTSRHLSRKLGRVAVYCVAITWLGHTAAFAQSGKKLVTETRSFRISVDGKESGTGSIVVDTFEDGTNTMHIDKSIKFNDLGSEYHYQSTGNETWKNGQLLKLDNIADVNGTRFHLDGKMGAKTFRVAVDGVNTDFPADSWPTSYWQIPSQIVTALKKNTQKVSLAAAGTKSATVVKPKATTLLSTDKGTRLNGDVQFVGKETLTVAGKVQASDHYRIAGDVRVNLWYDTENRLVRQHSVDSGHATLLEMTQLTVYRHNK